MKLESHNKHTTCELPTNETGVKQEVDYAIQLEKTHIPAGSHSNNIAESMTIKSEQVEVYIVDFINAVKANIHASKPLIPEIIGSGSSIQRLQDK